jgi:hypothetical protein
MAVRCLLIDSKTFGFWNAEEDENEGRSCGKKVDLAFAEQWMDLVLPTNR